MTVKTRFRSYNNDKWQCLLMKLTFFEETMLQLIIYLVVSRVREIQVETTNVLQLQLDRMLMDCAVSVK